MSGLLQRWRLFLILARVSTLPTIWSNCLAAWLLTNGRFGYSTWRFLLLCLGASCLATGGAFLREALDNNPDRPWKKDEKNMAIITEKILWSCGIGCMVAGVILFGSLGIMPLLIAGLLALCLLILATARNVFILGPVIAGICRFVIYLLAASAVGRKMGGDAVWTGMAMAVYVAGTGCLLEKHNGQFLRWPAVLLAVPVVLALFMNTGIFWSGALLLSVVLGAWTLRTLGRMWWTNAPDLNAGVTGFLAGIVFVDWLAVAPMGREYGYHFMILFALTLIIKRLNPQM